MDLYMRKALISLIIATFISTGLPYFPVHADGILLPIPGKMLELSKPYKPVMVKG